MKYSKLCNKIKVKMSLQLKITQIEALRIDSDEHNYIK